MKSEKTLTEAHNYLVYVAEALASVSKQFNIDRQDRTILQKYANDLYEYSESIEQFRKNIVVKEELKKKEFEEEQTDKRK